MTTRFIVGDTETTGVSDHDKVCEIAWLEIDSGFNVLSEVRSLIDPQIPIPPNAVAVHEITDQMVEFEPTIEEFIDLLDDKTILTAPTVLIAHNAQFDERFFKQHFTQLLTPLCTLRLARQVFPNLGDHKLQTLRVYFGIEKNNAHSALGDVSVLLQVLQKFSEILGKDLQALYEASLTPTLVETMPFGKHKGVPMGRLPTKYLSWLSNQDWLDLDMRHTVDKLLGV